MTTQRRYNKTPIKHDQGKCNLLINRLYSARPKLQLASCCLASDIKLENAHSALGDARATAALFSFYLQKLDLNNLPWNDLCQQSLDCFWPKDLPKSTQPFPHAETLRKEPADAWLSQLVASIPSINVPKIDSYMAALETCLLDSELSKTEKSLLIILAENCGIRRSQVDEIHRKTFQLMVIRT
ncbi:MAG: hypothetical protein SPG61_02880, partial [Arcanobacterium sp.]|nr:hypothetical protein [Arcanobacterium sp.]